MMGDIHVKLLVIRHGPDHAKLVPQVMPQSAFADILYDASLEALGTMSHDVPDVDMEAPEHLFTGLGKLLDRIENPDIIRYTQENQKVLVGFFVNAGLKTAQVDRDPVGDPVVQSFPHALS
jgi:hypothetical protein